MLSEHQHIWFRVRDKLAEAISKRESLRQARQELDRGVEVLDLTNWYKTVSKMLEGVTLHLLLVYQWIKSALPLLLPNKTWLFVMMLRRKYFVKEVHTINQQCRRSQGKQIICCCKILVIQSLY